MKMFLANTGLILDLSIVAIILLFVVIGLCMGFMRSLFSLVRFAGSFIVSYLLRSPCGALINKIFHVSEKISPKVSSSLVQYSSALSETASNNPDVLKEVVNNSSMGSILKRLCNLIIGNDSFDTATTVVDVVSSKAGYIISMLIAIAVMYVLIRVLTFFLPKIFKKLTKKTFLGKIDRIFGLIFGFVKGVAVVFAMFFVMSFVSALPSAAEKIQTATEQSKICSVLYEPVNDYIYQKLGIDKITDSE